MKKSIASLAAGLLLASSAQAAVYTFEYTASINGLKQGRYGDMSPVTASTVPGAEFILNDTVTGTISYDTAAADQVSQFVSPSYSKATYDEGLTGHAIVISMSASRIGQSGTTNYAEAEVLDSRNPAKQTDAVKFSGGGKFGLGWSYPTLDFGGTSVDVLHQVRLPGQELTAFETGTFNFTYYFVENNVGQELFGNGVITSIKLVEVSQVPEPATYALMIAGLGVLAWRRRAQA